MSLFGLLVAAAVPLIVLLLLVVVDRYSQKYADKESGEDRWNNWNKND